MELLVDADTDPARGGRPAPVAAGRGGQAAAGNDWDLDRRRAAAPRRGRS